MLFRRNLVLNRVDAVNQKELFDLAASKLLMEGYVKQTYLEGLTTRESKFPTGLKTKSIDVAIPHCDPEYIDKDGVLVVRPIKPIIFNEMVNPTNSVQSRLIFFICSTGGTEQLESLRQMMNIFKDDKFLTTLYQAEDMMPLLFSWKG
ncbi:PTS sugar transporter subunit IIA [Lacticaseibacillus paracasei subsp. tolerans]|uniref:PTS sugar transporter subunit IIA n=1 Tax=Lacticaseibacillus paracasei TaxID=1597 RepID=A0ABD5D022_LACPA|nr:PTS sugar transporter subunit IIA [Lacticaseibacillus paracasei]EPC85940.1 PTS system mannitol/fructose-specific transporter subunit IIA domain-containing protein [Lacticaseibacillus paracasei subsp. paracasei CNCM I-4649]MDR7625482.1 PTS sugar transporter subunit IIA [Lacticaseibacillus paracasei]QPC12918.1 PTS sugar transporter subunit IIA [Lacticaseibacillus paracasei subsp. tolerans]